jgi:hypothetical protein
VGGNKMKWHETRQRATCSKCEYFDGGGQGSDGEPISRHGDCHNPASGRFQTTGDDWCKGFFPGFKPMGNLMTVNVKGEGMTPTEKRIEMMKLLVEQRCNDKISRELEKPGDTILRALRALSSPPSKKEGGG